MIESKFKVGDILIYIHSPKNVYVILNVLPVNEFTLKNITTGYILKNSVDIITMQSQLRHATKLEKALL